MAYDNEITFGGKVLNVTSVTPVKTQKTTKQKIGKSVAQIRIIGLNTQQWELSVSGYILGTTSANKDTNRSNLEALDDADAHAWVDGLHNGTYIVTNLKFDDTGETVHTHYAYSFKLVEE